MLGSVTVVEFCCISSVYIASSVKLERRSSSFVSQHSYAYDFSDGKIEILSSLLIDPMIKHSDTYHIECE